MKLHKVTAASAAVLALALTATACGSDDKADSGSAGSGGGGKITIGIKIDQPGIGLKTPDGKYTGFDVDVATYIAKELGYDAKDITFKETKSADRETAIERGDVKFIAASYSINDKRLAKVDFAGPYLLAHQDILVRADDDSIKSPADLNSKKLCSVTGSTSATNVKEKLAPKAQLQKYGGYSECLTGLENKVIDAVTTDDSILAGYASQETAKGKFKLAGFKMSNENYGIGLKKGDADLKKKIDAALTKMVSDGSWDKAVKANFGPAGYKYEPAPKIGNIVK
ncbi:glutamate ABC transporter substrate-binding protein [Streptomyces sp. NBC_00879]|uniref:glutamate ABC transporter substrate-binding protein n=1 Tax=Streptomyces sp. NBC_00879 TaxID=2975855 RepID=UPI00386DBB7B|nr:glutamate ABC transporter substrate-binding protein [Streptomyces sp. NBC_00879]